VIFSVVCLLMCRLLGCLMVLARREASKDAELLVLLWVPRSSSAALTSRVAFQAVRP
jgi:hypothetical protein